MAHVSEEICLQGVPISGGIAIGTLHIVHHDEAWAIPEYDIAEEHLEREILRYRQALSKSCEELAELQSLFFEEGGEEGAKVIEAQVEMLKDPFLTEGMEVRIGQSKKNGESVFKGFINEYMTRLPDPERFLDVKDVAARVLKNLYPQNLHHPVAVQSIICSYELVPSYTAEATLGEVQAFVTELGGSTSHTALIAKSKAIPYVSHVNIHVLKENGGAVVIVDGNYGDVIVNPSEATLNMYRDKQRGQRVRFEPITEEKACVYTRDGTRIDVQANVENLADLDLLKRAKIQTIGLVRSEFLPFGQELEKVSEEGQYQLYRKLIQLAGNMEIVFRLFDVGSDKKLLSQTYHEPNPALGERSIRFLLKHKKMFVTQIRAILRASQFGKVHILLPLVTDIRELVEAKQQIYSERDRLVEEGIPLPEKISIGCMVEVPAFVLMCDQMVTECDFLSIGTNDLIQYTLAIDRSNPLTSDRYGEAHPSILRMIAHVVKVAGEAGVPVSICGEIASSSLHTETLLRLGVRALSCAPRYIALIKTAIRNTTL